MTLPKRSIFKKAPYDHKLLPFTSALFDQMDKLPLWGMIVRDMKQHEWNPSNDWHRAQQIKLGKRFSRRRHGNTLLIIRIE